MEEQDRIRAILAHRGAPEESIPDIALYMDQVTGYLDRALGEALPGGRAPALTRTMINNYVKSRVVPRPLKKRYQQEHLKALLVLFHLKNVLSLEEIRSFLAGFADGDEGISSLYRMFLEVQEEVMEQAREKAKSLLDPAQDEDEKNRLLFRLLLEADINKRLAGAVLKKE